MSPNPEQQRKSPESNHLEKSHQFNVSADELSEMMEDPDFAEYFNSITGKIILNPTTNNDVVEQTAAGAIEQELEGSRDGNSELSEEMKLAIKDLAKHLDADLPDLVDEEKSKQLKVLRESKNTEIKKDLQARLFSLKENQRKKIAAVEEEYYQIQQKILELGQRCKSTREDFEESEKKLNDILFVQGKESKIDAEGRLKIDTNPNPKLFKENPFHAADSTPEDPKFHTGEVDEEGNLKLTGTTTESGRYSKYLKLTPEQLSDAQTDAEQNYHLARSNHEQAIFAFREEVQKLVPANAKIERVTHEDDAAISVIEKQLTA